MEKQDVLLARQPIYNREQEIVAYELLFRDCDKAVRSEFDGNKATSRVLLSLFTDSDLTTVTNKLPAFVNFTEELIHSPPLFDPEAIVIEILEDIPITPQLIDSVKVLKQKGFKIALDDFVLDKRYIPLLTLVDIVKLEIPEMPGEALRKTIDVLRKYNVELLAEKVETHEEFKQCVELGCTLFQGYFLSQPEDVKGKKMAGNKIAVLNLIAELQAPEVDIEGLTQVITRDPSLSFKLLKLINSAAYRRSKEIDSIHRAVNMLGLDRIKSWASLLALSKIEDKPQSLHYLALVRALFCERIADAMGATSKDLFYTVGLFSCLDAFFDQPMEEIVANIAFDPIIKSALMERNGPAGLAVDSAIKFEQSLWKDIHWNELEQHGLSAKEVNEIFYDSAKEAVEAL